MRDERRHVEQRQFDRRPAVWRALLSPGGALLAGVCFFLPWGRVSCAGIEREASGAEIGGWVWLVFAAAVLVLLASVAGRRLVRGATARSVAFGAALGGLLFLGWRAVEFSRGVQAPFGRVRPEQTGFEPSFGFLGTVVGLLVALAGAMIPRPSAVKADRA